MSLGEIPFVFALVFAGGLPAILAGALGRILVLALHRKLPVIRLAFNFGVFLLGNCVAVSSSMRLPAPPPRSPKRLGGRDLAALSRTR